MTHETFCLGRGLRAPKGLSSVLNSAEGRSLEPYIYWPDLNGDRENSLAWALGMLRDADTPPPENYLPLLPVDDASIACAVCGTLDDPNLDEGCEVVRWHLGNIDLRFQGAVLDTDAGEYVRSVAEELQARREGLAKIRSVTQRYHNKYVAKGVRPRAKDLRPVQLASQNVIIGMATLMHDATFDGLRVPLYLTCEVPHLATHEANRAMAALLLCDAFQNGGTMEIRFGIREREEIIPPALRRFGRSLGLILGTEDSNAISPAEARDLFLGVTPMPDDLRARSFDLIDRGVISPERLCFTLMSNVWRAVELDYLAATSSRVASILEGGAPPELRRRKLAEIEVCRAALMIGMLHRRLNSTDAAGRSSGSARVFEDDSVGVAWTIREDVGAVAMSSFPEGAIPWTSPTQKPVRVRDNGLLIAIPRGLPVRADHDLVLNLQRQHPSAIVVLLTPIDMADTVPAEVPLLLCPDRLAELDAEIERKLGSLRVGRS